MTQLPTDANNHPIQALSLNGNHAHTLNATATASRTAKAFQHDTKVILVHGTVAFHILLGDDKVTATTTAHRFPAGQILPLDRKSAEHATIIKAQDEDNGSVFISEMK